MRDVYDEREADIRSENNVHKLLIFIANKENALEMIIHCVKKIYSLLRSSRVSIKKSN